MAGRRRKVSFDDIHAGKCHPIEHIHHMLVYHPNDQKECLAKGEEEPQPPQPFDYADDFDQVYDQTAKDVVNDMLDTIDVVDDLVDNVDQQEEADDEDIDQTAKDVVNDMLDTIEVVDDLVDTVEQDELMDILDGEDEDDLDALDEEWLPDSTGQEKEEELSEMNERRCLGCYGEEEPLEQCCNCEASSNLWHYQCVANMIIANEDRACTRCHYRYHHPDMERRIRRNRREIWRFLYRTAGEVPEAFGGLVFAVILIVANFVVFTIPDSDVWADVQLRTQKRTLIWIVDGIFSLVVLLVLFWLIRRYRREETGFHDEILFHNWPEPGVYPNNTRVYVLPGVNVNPPYQQNLPV